MRKDVRIGLAIAGVLVVLLIVYAIIPRNKDTKSVAQNTEVPPSEVGSEVPPVEPEMPPVTETSTPPQGNKGKDPFGPGDTSNGKVNGTDLNRPTESPGAGESSSGSAANWLQILDSGQLPRAERGTGAPPLYSKTAPPSSSGNGAGIKSGDAHLPAKPSETSRTERPLYGPETSGRSTTTAPSDIPQGSLVPPATPGGTGERTHLIQKGETLSSISEMAYGSSKYYTLIQKANPNLDDRRLKVGTTLKIPERSESAAPTVASRGSSRSSGAPPLAAVRRTGETSTANTSTEYEVQPGDTLYRIAIKLYGKGSRMQKIVDANKAVLGNDPDSLKIGMRLKLPEPPTVSASASR